MLLILATIAHAGLLDTLTEEQRQLQLCADAAGPQEAARDWGAAATTWEQCATDLRAHGATGSLPPLMDQSAVLRAMKRHEPLRQSEPGRWGSEILSVAARQSTTIYPSGAVLGVFRAWAATQAGKERLADVSTVTLAWVPTSDLSPEARAARTRHAELYRRYVEDLGLRWAEPGSPDIDVIVRAQVVERELPPRTTARMGALARRETVVRVADVRFPRLDRTADGYESRSAAEAVTGEEARDEALRAAMAESSAQLLKVVLRAAFPVEAP